VARWPLPALGVWSLAWALNLVLPEVGAPAWAAAAAATALGLGLALFGRTRLRALVIAGGFPVSLLASGSAWLALPAWAWLLPLALLLLLYPRNAWRDAPLYPTPAHALDALSAKVSLRDGARVLDAGCGLGHGLQALRRAFPRARLEGVEWSWPLALLARWRCRWAMVSRADMWAASWRGYELVYLFQRPESLPRAMAKAAAELAPGAWLASLEFEAVEWLPQAVLPCADGRPIWLYRLPLRAMPAGARNSSARATGR
jgi:SAM-dependent methyltransferase